MARHSGRSEYGIVHGVVREMRDMARQQAGNARSKLGARADMARQRNLGNWSVADDSACMREQAWHATRLPGHLLQKQGRRLCVVLSLVLNPDMARHFAVRRETTPLR